VEASHEERRSVVASGKTVENAIANGLTMLGVLRHQVDIEVLSEGSRGVLGFGAENARVRLLVKPQAEPEPKPLVEPPPGSALQPIAKLAAPEAPPPRPAQPAPKQAKRPAAEKVGREILTDLLGLMGIQATVKVELGKELAEEGQPPPTVLHITGEDLGILIGRRGETLRTLQYLVRLMVSHRLKHWTDLVVDVEHYRVRRRRALDNLAQRVAERVAREGKAQALEPMPAYERRLIHIALRNHPDVTTQSVGEGERRKVTIIPRK
jgi:spoIIIJ-associated protein